MAGLSFFFWILNVIAPYVNINDNESHKYKEIDSDPHRLTLQKVKDRMMSNTTATPRRLPSTMVATPEI